MLFQKPENNELGRYAVRLMMYIIRYIAVSQHTAGVDCRLYSQPVLILAAAGLWEQKLQEILHEEINKETINTMLWHPSESTLCGSQQPHWRGNDKEKL